MLTAVASDLPQIENRRSSAAEHNSYLYDDMGVRSDCSRRPTTTSSTTTSSSASTAATRSSRSRTSASGTTPASTSRAWRARWWPTPPAAPPQGASTIAEQFVKNALAQEGNRTILEKVREAALAFQLTHRWSKTKILREYLNTIYFGNGAYGIESAARVYFGSRLGYNPDTGGVGSSSCGDSTPQQHLPSCASQLRPYQAALLAGMIANPTAFNPVYHPRRRDSAAQPRPAGHARPALHHARPVPSTGSTARCRTTRR